jgi:hypothetical protein
MMELISLASTDAFVCIFLVSFSFWFPSLSLCTSLPQSDTSLKPFSCFFPYLLARTASMLLPIHFLVSQLVYAVEDKCMIFDRITSYSILVDLFCAQLVSISSPPVATAIGLISSLTIRSRTFSRVHAVVPRRKPYLRSFSTRTLGMT